MRIVLTDRPTRGQRLALEWLASVEEYSERWCKAQRAATRRNRGQIVAALEAEFGAPAKDEAHAPASRR